MSARFALARSRRRTPSWRHEAGINFFFITADMHWHYYEQTRVGLRELLASSGVSRDDVVVAGVSYPTQPEFCSVPFLEIIEASPWIGRLDVCVMGGVYASDFYARLSAYERHKTTSHCGARAIGATFHDRRSSPVAINRGLVDIAFIRYNAAHSGADSDVFPALNPGRTTPLFGFTSTYGHITKASDYDALGVGEDKWRPEVVDHYRYALSAPLDGLLCSPRTPSQLESLIKGLERGPLNNSQLEYMRTLGDLFEGRVERDVGHE